MRAADEQSALAGERNRAPAEGPRALLGGETDELLRAFLREDIGPGDVTSEALVGAGVAGRGRLRAKSEGVLAGLAVFVRVFELLDSVGGGAAGGARASCAVRDGERVRAGTVVCEIEASARALLGGERTALNLVQRLSGIATLTRRFVEAAEAACPGVGVYDTRKTTPGLRRLEKHAVLCGGGRNHRFALYDEAMVKNNHVDVTGRDLRELVSELRARRGTRFVIHAEARDADEALAAVAGGADVVLLDNMDVALLRELCPRIRAAAARGGRAVAIEASGGVDLSTIGAIAASGVDRVSVGALTHSAPALDLSFAIERTS